MTQEQIKERIAKKEQEIAKMEKNLVKYVVDEEFTSMCDRFFQSKDRTELKNYCKSHNLMWLPEYYSKRYALEDAKATLVKYQKQLEIQIAKDNTLSDIPEVLKQFKEDLIKRWDKFDAWKKEQIVAEYKKICEDAKANGYNCDYTRKAYREMREKWGINWCDFMYNTTENIHKANVTAADTLVLNLIERTIELAGKITDCQYLRLDQDNQGYCIVNGIVIGEKGKAKVESIGAGGYNIQRYHIRVLVKAAN